MVEVAQQVQMLLGPRAGGKGRSTSPNVTRSLNKSKCGLGLVVRSLNKSKCGTQQVQMLLGLGLVVGRSTSPNVTRARAGGKGRSTSPNVTQG